MKLFRSRVFTPLRESYAYWDDAYLAVGDDGRIAGVGPWPERPNVEAETIEAGPHALITPGLIDTHLHAPQLEMIGSYGGDLLAWLNRYTFPT